MFHGLSGWAFVLVELLVDPIQLVFRRFVDSGLRGKLGVDHSD